MAPLIPSAKITLTYPLWACDFDPLDASRLVVGGGGGSGRSGVGNKITVLDTSNSSELQEVAEIDLSKDEDSVTSLAVSQKKGAATLVYAGVNSKPSDVEKGKTLHFRVFGIEPTTKGKGSSATAAIKISEISRSKLFSRSEKDAYQRITRLSKPYPNQPQLGAVATGMAKRAEIVLFDTSSTNPPKYRGAVISSKEVVDVDFLQTGKDEYLVAYCNEYDIYVKSISSRTDKDEPQQVYEIPMSKSEEKPSVPSFRALRWLTKDFMLMLTNIHSQGGVVLQILRLPPSGKGQARIAQSHRLPSNIKRATGLAVANLTPPSSPTASQDYTQFVVAVGHDISISLFKVDFQTEGSQSMVTAIKPFRTFNSIHPNLITSLAFSNFTPPSPPIKASTPQQTLKLASVGASNTVVIHNIPLFPVPLSVQRGQSKSPRYVVALPSGKAVKGFGAFLSVLLVLLAAVIAQGVLEIRGVTPERLGARQRLPVIWQEALGKPYSFPAGYTSIKSAIPDSVAKSATGALHLPDFLERLEVGKGSGVVVVKDGTGEGEHVEAKVHNEDVHGPHGGTEWEELSPEQRDGWKRRLTQAGYWVEEMGETVLKGVVFGELGGIVERVVAGG